MTAPEPVDPDFADQESLSAQQMVIDLSQQLDYRLGDIQKWQAYYDGKQPLRFATEEFSNNYGALYAGFADNWCAPVVDTTAEKLTVAGLFLGDDSADGEDDGMGGQVAQSADPAFAKWWAANECQAESSMAFTEAGVNKRAFALVWGSDDSDIPDITFETADEAIVGYEPGSRRRRKAGLKRWTDGEYDMATLYLAGKIWKWQRLRPKPPGDGEAYTPDKIAKYRWMIRTLPGGEPSVISNPAGVVPLIELANRPRLKSEPLSDVAGAAAMQDAINLLWSYLFTAADFGVLPARVALNVTTPKVPVLDANGQPTGAFRDVDIKSFLNDAKTKRFLAFQGDKAEIDQWDSVNLDILTNAIEFAVGHLAAQSRTPAHYFTGKISNIPADGLVALAQAHIAKVQERSVYHSRSIKDIAAAGYLMTNQPAKAQAALAGRVSWEDFELRSEAQMADYAIKLRQAGFSFEFVAAKFISDPLQLKAEIDRHNTEQAQQAAAMQFGPKLPPLLADAAPGDGTDTAGG